MINLRILIKDCCLLSGLVLLGQFFASLQACGDTQNNTQFNTSAKSYLRFRRRNANYLNLASQTVPVNNSLPTSLPAWNINLNTDIAPIPGVVVVPNAQIVTRPVIVDKTPYFQLPTTTQTMGGLRQASYGILEGSLPCLKSAVDVGEAGMYFDITGDLPPVDYETFPNVFSCASNASSAVAGISTVVGLPRVNRFFNSVSDSLDIPMSDVDLAIKENGGIPGEEQAKEDAKFQETKTVVVPPPGSNPLLQGATPSSGSTCNVDPSQNSTAAPTGANQSNSPTDSASSISPNGSNDGLSQRPIQSPSEAQNLTSSTCPSDASGAGANLSNPALGSAATIAPSASVPIAADQPLSTTPNSSVPPPENASPSSSTQPNSDAPASSQAMSPLAATDAPQSTPTGPTAANASPDTQAEDQSKSATTDSAATPSVSGSPPASDDANAMTSPTPAPSSAQPAVAPTSMTAMDDAAQDAADDAAIDGTGKNIASNFQSFDNSNAIDGMQSMLAGSSSMAQQADSIMQSEVAQALSQDVVAAVTGATVGINLMLQTQQQYQQEKEQERAQANAQSQNPGGGMSESQEENAPGYRPGRTIASNRRATTTSTQQAKERVWVCNYMHYPHTAINQCSKPQLGGTWEYR